MNILFYGLNSAPDKIGFGNYSGELASWFVARGHQMHLITAPPYFPSWCVEVGYRNRFCFEQLDNMLVQRCPLWVPRRPTGLSRLLHLASFAVTSLVPLLFKRRWRPDVVVTVAPAFFCAPGAL